MPALKRTQVRDILARRHIGLDWNVYSCFALSRRVCAQGRRVRRQRPDNGVNTKRSFYGLNAPSVASDTLPTNVFVKYMYIST